jgi:hypothetical protein
MIYAINIVTVTKSTDLYDAVAVNKFPILVTCDSRDELYDILKEEQIKIFCQNTIKTKNLYDHSKFYIREFDVEADTTPESFIEDVSKYIQLNYGRD